jgi:putative addiction module component (TIGR02574 family)
MTSQSRHLFDAALALPEKERALLAECLLESLPLEQDDLTEDALTAELERRLEEYRQDPSVAVPWSEVKGQE